MATTFSRALLILLAPLGLAALGLAPLPAQDLSVASAKQKEWTEAALQLDSVERREATLAVMRQALASGDDRDAVLAALGAVAQVHQLDYDKKSFAALVRVHLKAPETAIRRAAWYALYHTLPEPADAKAIAELVRDEAQEIRFAAPHLLSLFGKGDFESEVPSKAVLELLDATPPREWRMFLSGLWGGRFSPDLEARFLELEPIAGEVRYEVFYFALSTQGNKSPAAVERLIQIALGSGGEAERALWGLARGVTPAAGDRVAEFAVKLYAARTGSARERALQLVRDQGTKRHAAALRELLAKPALLEADRKQLLELADQLETVPDRSAAAPADGSKR